MFVNKTSLYLTVVIVFFFAIMAVYYIYSVEEHVKKLEREVDIKERVISLHKEDVKKLETRVRNSKANEDLLRRALIRKSQVEKSIEGNIPIPLGKFESTAYDLSFDSCEKDKSDPYYGVTASGIQIDGLSWEEARMVATDPSVIPTGSRLYIKYPKPYEGKTGIYVAGDKGGAIKGRLIDTFVGDFNQKHTSKEVVEFGRREVEIYLLQAN